MRNKNRGYVIPRHIINCEPSRHLPGRQYVIEVILIMIITSGRQVALCTALKCNAIPGHLEKSHKNVFTRISTLPDDNKEYIYVNLSEI